MAGFNIVPQTITGKVRTRTPTQAQSLSSRYTFLNLQNVEPNLGIPGPAGTSPETTEGYVGLRYALLSNNHSNGLSAWRVWSFDNPRVAFYSVENSLGIGENANPIRINSIVYNNHPYGTNRYNSESLAENSFNVYSLSGIYLFDSTTVGDPASAVSLVVTESGNVGINTEFPYERLTVSGNISASGALSANANAGWHLFSGSVCEGSLNTASGVSSHAEGEDNDATGEASHAEGAFNLASGFASHVHGRSNMATGNYSHASGENSWADGVCSHAIGHSSVVRDNWSFMWSDALSGTLVHGVSSTRACQFAVSASGGVFFPGKVGIGTDNNTNALTVVGTISTNAHFTSKEWSYAYTNLTANSANYLSGYNLTAVAAASASWGSNYTTTKANSANWNEAYNRTTSYPLLTAINYAPYNLLGALATNTNIFTVPAGRKFICKSFGLNVMEVAGTASASSSIKLVNVTRGNVGITNSLTPSLTLDNTYFSVNTNNVAASAGEVVALRMTGAAITGATVLSASMFIEGYLI